MWDYDFSVNETVREEDLKRIEKKMKELIKRKFPIEKYSIPKDEALEKFSSDELRLAVLSRLMMRLSQSINQGSFEDLLVEGSNIGFPKLPKFS